MPRSRSQSRPRDEDASSSAEGDEHCDAASGADLTRALSRREIARLPEEDNTQAVPQQGPRMVQVISVSGNLLHVTEPYTNYLTHRRRQRADFTLEELLEPCAEYLRWPKSHIQLACGEVRVRAHHRIADRTRTLVWQPGEHGVRQVTVIKEPMPEDFEVAGGCICEFGGCCKLCQVLSLDGCPGCGSGPGCCLCANCGCDCCCSADPPVLPDDAPRCPYRGCQEQHFANWKGLRDDHRGY